MCWFFLSFYFSLLYGDFPKRAVLAVKPTHTSSEKPQLTDFQKARREILMTKLRPSDEAKTRSDTTVFDHLVHSDVTEAEFGGPGGFARLAQLMSQAGSHRIHLTLTNIITNVLLDKEKEQKLRAEIAPLFVDGKNPPAWRDLERAPYLSSCVKEGLRSVDQSD